MDCLRGTKELPPIMFFNVALRLCPFSGFLHVLLVWAGVKVTPCVQQYQQAACVCCLDCSLLVSVLGGEFSFSCSALLASKPASPVESNFAQRLLLALIMSAWKLA